MNEVSRTSHLNCVRDCRILIWTRTVWCEKDIRGCFEAGAKRVSIDFTEGTHDLALLFSLLPLIPCSCVRFVTYALLSPLCITILTHPLPVSRILTLHLQAASPQSRILETPGQVPIFCKPPANLRGPK